MSTDQRLAQLCFFLTCISAGAGLMFVPTFAQDAPDTTPTPAATETYTQGCAECHLDIVSDWQDSPHAAAFQHDALQSAVADGDGAVCLECHVTGFQPFSGDFTHQNVTCEACHGQTPEDHPDEAIAVSASAAVCADCHATTYREWEVSAHGAADLNCVSCHHPHEPGLRFETANALCTNCHAPEEIPNYAHETHTDQTCTECHWHHGELDNDQHVLTGALGASGHDAHVETIACLTCHENEAQQVSTESDDGELGEFAPVSQVTLRELEAEVANVRAQGANVAAVRLLQGGVVGLAFGAVLMFVFIRLRPGQRFDEEGEE